MLNKLRVIVKQILCVHERQEFICNTLIVGGNTHLSEWKCTRCNATRYDVPVVGHHEGSINRQKFNKGWKYIISPLYVEPKPLGKRRNVVR